MDMLIKYPWPGNVRELENAVERAVVLLFGSYVSERELPLAVTQAYEQEDDTEPSALSVPLEGATLEDVEREAILRMLDSGRQQERSGKAAGHFPQDPAHRLNGTGRSRTDHSWRALLRCQTKKWSSAIQPCPIKYSSMRSVTFLWVSSANPANDEPFRQRMNPDQAAQYDEQQRAEPEPLHGGCQPFRARRNHLEAQAGLNVLF